MSLRDYFAAHAPSMAREMLRSRLSKLRPNDRNFEQNEYAAAFGSVVAAWRYEHADAMLAERARRGGK